ncbi:organic cation transporter protein-like [Haliotis rubra]|uniref:organic cation transporter protein-like n=1 Tax=Haliotis rubra TaxID=36100 RepID=UPI001EE528B4|nr:organic cation transporter protein-like [Haliotis rubra]
MKFEDIVKLLGDFGPYQKRLYFLLCIPMISVGIQTMMTVFTLGVPEHSIGRKKMFMGSVILHIVSAISIAFVPNFAILGLLYCINGMSGIAIWGNAFVVGVELVGPSKRVYTGIVCELFWTCGSFITATLAFFVRDWQRLQLIVSVPTVLFVVYHWFMPESPRWLISKKKYEEADRILRHAAKVNKTNLPSDIFSGDMLDFTTEKPLRLIFTNPTLALRSLVMFFNWFVVAIGFYGLGLNVANLGGSVYTNFYISSAAELKDPTSRQFAKCLPPLKEREGVQLWVHTDVKRANFPQPKVVVSNTRGSGQN